MDKVIDAGAEEDDLWRQFWMYYRADNGKATQAEVASIRGTSGGRTATTGALPTIPERILQEQQLFEKFNTAPPAVGTPLTPMTPMTPATPKTPKTPRTARSASVRPRSSGRSVVDYESWGFVTEKSATLQAAVGSSLEPVTEEEGGRTGAAMGDAE